MEQIFDSDGFDERGVRLLHGDCLEVLRGMESESVDAVVTDPPYGLSFMGKAWDYDVPGAEVWAECLRVLKPGGHLLAFAGTRTQHRMAVKIEDAGFEIRDMIAWVYGSGFPKSLDVSKAIDKAAGAEREVVGPNRYAGRRTEGSGPDNGDACYGQYGIPGGETAPATEAAKQWAGWGTALKPALEPITVARKPMRGTVAENVLKHGTGALNVDGCRVGTEGGTRKSDPEKRESVSAYGNGLNGGVCESINAGRWPANLVHDGSKEVVGLFPETGPAKGGDRGAGKGETGCYGVYGGAPGIRGHTDNGGTAARFFYCAKASKEDRDEGCEGAADAVLARSCQAVAEAKRGNVVESEAGAFNKARIVKNNHPTVKPTDLMRWLCRLVTPPKGVVLDPFMGSGSTGKGAVMEGLRFIGIEREAEYLEIARARIAKAGEQGLLELW